LAVTVTERQCPRLRCPGCGKQRRAQLPADSANSAFGPRFHAAVAVLSVSNRVSRRDVVECCEQLFGARICSGTVDAILERVVDALVQPDADLLARVRGAKAPNMDETGWRTAGQRRALRCAFTDRHAVLRVADSRPEDHAKALLGSTTAIVTSDRWWAYSHLPVGRRQICWAHLRRDFKAHIEGLAAEKELRAAVGGALLGAPADLADEAVDIDHQPPVARPSAGPPGACQRLAQQPVQLAHVPERTRAQERAQRRRGRDPVTQKPARPPGPEHAAVIDAVRAPKHRVENRHHLAPDVDGARPVPTQPDQLLRERLDTKSSGERCDHHQPGVRHDPLIVENDMHAVQSDRLVIVGVEGEPRCRACARSSARPRPPNQTCPFPSIRLSAGHALVASCAGGAHAGRWPGVSA
jgi:hypothetical protein